MAIAIRTMVSERPGAVFVAFNLLVFPVGYVAGALSRFMTTSGTPFWLLSGLVIVTGLAILAINVVLTRKAWHLDGWGVAVAGMAGWTLLSLASLALAGIYSPLRSAIDLIFLAMPR